MRTRRTRDQASGFTLLEMLVVLVIISLIAAVAIPQVTKLLGGARSKAADIQLETLSQSLQHYEIDMGAFPTTEQGLQALWEAPADAPAWNGPYVRRQKQLIDPWNRPFIYRAPGDNAPYELVTLGADGQPGGTGDNADLSVAD